MPIHFEITGGQVHECKIAPQLVMELKGVEYIVGDKGYDSEARRIQIVDQGASACLYKYRHLVENAFARLKHFRSVATRLEKLKRNYEGMVALGCAIMWLPL